MPVEKFQDLVVWQKARVLTAEIYQLTTQGPFARDFGLRDQIQRAAVSVMSNIAEGFERGSRAEFHQFLVIAKGSCAELRSQLYTALDVSYIDNETFERVSLLAEEVSRILGGLRSSVARQRKAAA